MVSTLLPRALSDWPLFTMMQYFTCPCYCDLQKQKQYLFNWLPLRQKTWQLFWFKPSHKLKNVSQKSNHTRIVFYSTTVTKQKIWQALIVAGDTVWEGYKKNKRRLAKREQNKATAATEGEGKERKARRQQQRREGESRGTNQASYLLQWAPQHWVKRLPSSAITLRATPVHINRHIDSSLTWRQCSSTIVAEILSPVQPHIAHNTKSITLLPSQQILDDTQCPIFTSQAVNHSKPWRSPIHLM